MGCLERGLLAWGRQAVAISLIDHNDVLVILFPLGGIAYIKLAASFILPPPPRPLKRPYLILRGPKPIGPWREASPLVQDQVPTDWTQKTSYCCPKAPVLGEKGLLWSFGSMPLFSK